MEHNNDKQQESFGFEMFSNLMKIQKEKSNYFSLNNEQKQKRDGEQKQFDCIFIFSDFSDEFKKNLEKHLNSESKYNNVIIKHQK